MIPELREALYTYLTIPGNDFITLLGDNLFHKRPLNDANFPYCTFEGTERDRTIDSSDKFITEEITFQIFDGANDKPKESAISMDRLELLVQYLDDLLDAKGKAFTVTNYSLIDIQQKLITPIPTSSNRVQGQILIYDFKLQKRRFP